MEAATVIQILVGLVLTLFNLIVSVMLIYINFRLNTADGEILSLRKRVHTVEGSTSTLHAHLGTFNSAITEIPAIDRRLVKVETALNIKDWIAEVVERRSQE